MQHLVADIVSQGVIDFLELVQIDEERGDRDGVGRAALKRPPDHPLKQGAIRQPSQGIVGGTELRIGFVPSPRGHVVKNPHEVSDPTRFVVDRADPDLVPEGRSVLAAVQQHDVCLPSRCDGLSQCRHLGLLAVNFALQEPAVLAQDFVP